MSTQLEILVTEGPLKGRCFPVPPDGLRLGRSSSCEISIPDPALSRNHCLFETRDGGLWVTDLASANGTMVNDVQLGPDSQLLKLGDTVFVGDSVLRAVAAGGAVPAPAPGPEPAPALPKIDLGLGGGSPPPDGKADAAPDGAAARSSWLRYALWCVALLSVLAASLLIVLPVPTAEPSAPEAKAGDMGEILSFTYEKVVAGPHSIFRYALVYDGKSLRVEADDALAGRHVAESAKLSDDERARIEKDFLSETKLYGLSPEYVGTPSETGSLKSYALHVVRSRRVLDVSIENTSEPEEFQNARMKLEAFADSKFNLHALHMPVERLRELSAEAYRVAQAKWNERGDSNFANIAEALRKCDEAINYLKTVNPKPPDYERIRELRKQVSDKLEEVYKEHRVNADQAIGTQNWEAARKELQDLLKLVDDPNDERNKEVSRKLLEIEGRMKAKR